MSEILCSMLLHSVSIKTFFFVQMVEILYEFCCWILQYYQTRIDLKSTLSFWDLNQFDDPRFRHCGMWYTHVDTRVTNQLVGHVLDMTRALSAVSTRGESMIHSVASVLVWSIWVNHSCSHVSANTCLICLNLHLGHVLGHVEIFKYFLLYLLYVDNYFHRIKIYLQRKQCVLFYTVYDQQASQSKPVCIVQSF